MSTEHIFLKELRAVVFHLIKHDRKLYNHIVHIAKAQDEKVWTQLSPDQKVELVEEALTSLPALDAYYATYPHEYSRKRYEDFKSSLGIFYKELTGRDVPEA